MATVEALKIGVEENEENLTEKLKKKKKIAVFGGDTPLELDQFSLYNLAYEIGKEIVCQKALLLSGGTAEKGKSSIMSASLQGAIEVGGQTAAIKIVTEGLLRQEIVVLAKGLMATVKINPFGIEPSKSFFQETWSLIDILDFKSNAEIMKPWLELALREVALLVLSDSWIFLPGSIGTESELNQAVQMILRSEFLRLSQPKQKIILVSNFWQNKFAELKERLGDKHQKHLVFIPSSGDSQEMAFKAVSAALEEF